MKKIVLSITISLLVKLTVALNPDTVYYAKPNIYGLIFKEINFRTSDNIKLKGWFYPSQEALSEDSMKVYFNDTSLYRNYEFNQKIKSPTIIICNGDAVNMAQLLGKAYKFCTNGFNVFTFDWRGFGESQQWAIDKNYLIYEEFIIDYDASINALINLPEVDKERIGVFGFSTGAYMSFIIAGKREEIKAMAGRAIFTSYKELKENLKIKFKKDNLYYPEIFDVKYNLNMLSNKMDKPIFLIVGENDNRTPPSMSINIINNVNSKIRELWIVDGASHGGILAPEIIASDEFWKRIVRFYNENL